MPSVKKEKTLLNRETERVRAQLGNNFSSQKHLMTLMHLIVKLYTDNRVSFMCMRLYTQQLKPAGLVSFQI